MVTARLSPHLAAGALVGFLDLLPLLVAPLNQDIDDGVLIHTWEKKHL